jgi:Flp pilus assembly protein TadD
MKRKLLLCALPVVLIGASIPVYRSFTKTVADETSSPDVEVWPQLEPKLLVSHSGNFEREHEVKALQGELEKNPDHLPILMRLAQVSRDSGKLNDSIRYLRDAAAQNPKSIEANLELGRALFESGDVTGAIQATQRVLELDPRHVDALYNLGAIYGNLSQDNRAREYWEKLVSIAPDSESGRRAKENLPKLTSSR